MNNEIIDNIVTLEGFFKRLSTGNTDDDSIPLIEQLDNFTMLHAPGSIIVDKCRLKMLSISYKYSVEYLILSWTIINNFFKNNTPKSTIENYKSKYDYDFDNEVDKFTELFRQLLSEKNEYSLLDIKEDIVDISEKEADIYFDILKRLVSSQNQKFIQEKKNQLVINIFIYLAYIFNIKSNSSKWDFYSFSSSCVILLAQNGELQESRDLAETIYIISKKDNMLNAGIYVHLSQFTFQKKLNDSLYYSICFLNTLNNKVPKGIIISYICTLQKIFRDHNLLEYEEYIFNLVLERYQPYLNKKMYFQIHLSHFSTLLRSKSDICPSLEDFLNLEKENIFIDGVESIAAWYSLIKSTLRLFESDHLKSYYDYMQKMLPQTIIDGIHTQFGESKDIIQKFNLIASRIDKSRFHDDMTSEIKNYLPFFHNLIRLSHESQDFKLFINSFAYLSDLSLENSETNLDEKIVKISSKNENTKNIFQSNINKFNEMYKNKQNLLLLTGIENDIYYLVKTSEDFTISKLNFSISELKEFYKSMNDILNFEGNRELDYDQEKLYQIQKNKFLFLNFPELSSIENDLLVVTDIKLSIIPFNLVILKKENVNDYIFLNHPIYGIPYYNFPDNHKRVYINKDISFWSPLQTNDVPLNTAFSNLESILKKYKSDIYDDIELNTTLNKDISIIMAHGGKDIDQTNTISAKSGFSKIEYNYTYHNIHKIIPNPKLVLLFICHSGKISEDKFFERKNTILNDLFESGAEAIIAPKWPLGTDILPIWLNNFFSNFFEGESSFHSFYEASKKVKESYKNAGAWSCLHYIGNKDIYIKNT